MPGILEVFRNLGKKDRSIHADSSWSLQVEEASKARGSWVKRDTYYAMISEVDRENLELLTSIADRVLDDFGFPAHLYAVGSSLIEDLDRDPRDIDLMFLVEKPQEEAIYVGTLLERAFMTDESARVVKDRFVPYTTDDRKEGYLAPFEAVYVVGERGLRLDCRFPQPSDPIQADWIVHDETEPVVYLGQLGMERSEKRADAIWVLENRFIMRTKSV